MLSEGYAIVDRKRSKAYYSCFKAILIKSRKQSKQPQIHVHGIVSHMNDQAHRVLLSSYPLKSSCVFTDHMKLKKKEDQSVGALVLLRRGNKILTGANTKTKCGVETERKTIQRSPSPHLWIYPIYSH